MMYVNPTMPQGVNPVEDTVKRLRGGNVLIDKVVNRVRFKSTDDYAYCPYCRQRAMRGDPENWKDGLRTLWIVTHKRLLKITKDEGRNNWEKRFECDVCKKEITEEDFLECRPVAGFVPKVVDLSKINLDDPNFINDF